MKIKVKTLNELAKIPTKAYQHDAGFDLYAISDKMLHRFEPIQFDTGISLEIPEGYYGEIKDKSSLGCKGIKVLGGVIDSAYRGQIIVCLISLNQTHLIKAGQKIAQIIFLQHHGELIESDDLSETERAEKGFGSSGEF